MKFFSLLIFCIIAGHIIRGAHNKKHITKNKLKRHHIHKKQHLNPILKKFLTDQNNRNENEKRNNHKSNKNTDEKDGEYNITKTYDYITKFHKLKKKHDRHKTGSKRQMMKHGHHGVNVLKYTGHGIDEGGAMGSMFMSTEPLGTPVTPDTELNGMQQSENDYANLDSNADAGFQHGNLDSNAVADFQHGNLDSNVNTGFQHANLDFNADAGFQHAEQESDEIPVGPLEHLDSSEHGFDSLHHHEPWLHGIQHHQVNFHQHPTHVYEKAIEKTEEGVDHGGYMSPEPINMRMPGARHIHKPPIHVSDPHSETSYETHIEHGKIHDHHCENGGLYFSMNELGYQCICPETHIGKNCQAKDYCNPCPCKNDATCHNIAEDPHYKCSCKRGSYGQQCERKDPCYPNPCKNHGSCTHDGSTATCVCTSRFRGKTCDLLNNCAPNPCVNGGSCVEEKGDGKFSCECLVPWRGTICERHSYCHINPCANGGTCREGELKFECTCSNGFSGITCQDRVCQPNPCLSGGTCIEDGDKYKCVCLPWTSGSLCEENRPCLTKPCMHDGKCIDAFSGFHWSFGPLQYYCICKPPYKGMNCEQHACKNCHKNAHCVIDHCVCDESYEGNGEVCKKTENPCHPNPCLNNGVCTEQPDFCTGPDCGFKCSCPAPYVPPLCKEKNPCDPDPCVNGACTVQGSDFQCTCEYGYHGRFCNEKDGCLPNPCQHKGTCQNHNGTAQCSCIGEWKPPLCKECGCVQKNIKGVPNLACNLQGKCVCPTGYNIDSRTGECKLEKKEKANPCFSNPCQNGGTCYDVLPDDYRCDCQHGFSGKTCQYKNVCNPGPCLNGGTCTEKNGKFQGCLCPPKYVLPYCDKEEEKAKPGICVPNPCKNNGVCVANGGAYDCICTARFTGPHCDVDRCENCDKHARCQNGHCKCNPGYIGNGYTCERETCEVTCVQWSSCIDGQCICNPGYTKVSKPHVTQQCVPTSTLDYDDDDETSVVKTTKRPDIHTPIKPTPIKTTTLGRTTRTTTDATDTTKQTTTPSTTTTTTTTTNGGDGGDGNNGDGGGTTLGPPGAPGGSPEPTGAPETGGDTGAEGTDGVNGGDGEVLGPPSVRSTNAIGLPPGVRTMIIETAS